MFGLKVGLVDLTISLTSHNGTENSHDPMSSLKCTDFIVMSTIDTRTRRILNDTPNFPGATQITRPGDSLARRLGLLHCDSLSFLQSWSSRRRIRWVMLELSSCNYRFAIGNLKYVSQFRWDLPTVPRKIRRGEDEARLFMGLLTRSVQLSGVGWDGSS